MSALFRSGVIVQNLHTWLTKTHLGSHGTRKLAGPVDPFRNRVVCRNSINALAPA